MSSLFKYQCVLNSDICVELYIGARLLSLSLLNKAKMNRLERFYKIDQLLQELKVVSRDNWYLDAWCHMRDGLRGFSLDGIRVITYVNKKAIEVPLKHLDQFLAASYGIFAGEAKYIARLKFTPERARWVAAELWNPEQKGSFDESGSYILEFPFADDRELLLDIAKHGAAVEVLSPKSLRDKIAKEHEAAFCQYQR
jgi:predicted DNA-binding transcriptional regulator YafY